MSRRGERSDGGNICIRAVRPGDEVALAAALGGMADAVVVSGVAEAVMSSVAVVQ